MKSTLRNNRSPLCNIHYSSGIGVCSTLQFHPKIVESEWSLNLHIHSRSEPVSGYQHLQNYKGRPEAYSEPLYVVCQMLLGNGMRHLRNCKMNALLPFKCLHILLFTPICKLTFRYSGTVDPDSSFNPEAPDPTYYRSVEPVPVSGGGGGSLSTAGSVGGGTSLYTVHHHHHHHCCCHYRLNMNN